MIKFEVMWRTRAPDDEISIFSLNNSFTTFSTIYSFQAERLGVIAELLQLREIIFLDNLALRSLLSKASHYYWRDIFFLSVKANTVLIKADAED